jgi:uncharacterized protein YyaL (SSP411 family)
MVSEDSRPAVDWLAWTPEAFARAAAAGKPILLFLGAAWSPGCDEMQRTTFADAAVVALVRERFVPVRVDADARPDVNERYNLGGWPTTAFLTPDGDLLGGGTFIEPARLAAALADLAGAYLARRPEIDARAAARRRRDAVERPPHDPVPLAPASLDPWLDGVLLGAFDDEHGGFAGAPRFPHPDAVRLALIRWRETGDARFRRAAGLTLDRMGWGGLWDATAGGFFRCAARRDWGEPSPEKLLEVNAALAALYATAASALDDPRYLARAADTVRWARARLADAGQGGFFASERPGGAGVDRETYTDANAAMIAACLQVADLAGDADLVDTAVTALERVVLATYRPGAGVAHAAGGVRGLLVDQIALGHALADAGEATGRTPYTMLAEELARYALAALWDETDGGFLDRAPEGGGLGLLGERRKPFVVNCAAVRLLARLEAECGDGELGARAHATLASLARDAAAQGIDAASYGLASRAVEAVGRP